MSIIKRKSGKGYLRFVWRKLTAHTNIQRAKLEIRRLLISTFLTFCLFALKPSSDLFLGMDYFPLELALLIVATTIMFGPSFGLFTTISSLVASLIFPVEIDALMLTIFGLSATFFTQYKNSSYNKITTSEERLKTLVNETPQPVMLQNESGTISFISRSIQDLLNYTHNELKGKSIPEYIHPDEANDFKDIYQEVSENPGLRRSIELRLRAKNGTYIWVEIRLVNFLHDTSINSIFASLTDISVRKQLDEQRQRILEREKKARTEAEEAVKTRDEFLSVASHELKTPLTSILLQLQSTLRRILTQSLANFSGKKLVSSLKVAETQSQRLSFLIKDLLNVSLITSGRLELNREPGDLVPITRSAISGLADQIKLASSKVTLKSNGPLLGSWDSIRIEQCLTNLITNAVKYGNKKPVVVETSQINGNALVSVKDQGIGIEEKVMSKIFEPFKRGVTGNSYLGLGVGLFIARKIARAHGGDIELKSVPKNGSEFTLRLPLEKS